ncbi:MAG: DNA repair helicase XPB, partial [Candidatus Phosphoribacter baldrii]
RAPEHIHTYRVTPLGLWNARAAGHDAEQVIDALLRHSRYAVPQALLVDVAETMARYGRLTIEKDPAHGLVLRTTDRPVLEEVLRHRRIEPLLGERIDPDTILVHPSERGHLKQQLLKVGWPAEDLAGYVDGEAHPIALREEGWTMRPYQRQAVEGFWHGGSGVVVLPCGAGKTIVGAGAMAAASATTLILVTNTVAARQWKDELLRRTSLTDKEIGEYSGTRKEIRPVTIATYQVLSVRRRGVYPHLELLDARDWGLVVYDEVHLLPAPIFRMTADLQARRRLGLTATLVREDGREGDVFSLIGPKRFDAPWKDIEAQGWIAPADCVEVRVTLGQGERMSYAVAEADDRYRLASCTPGKERVVQDLVARHTGEPTLVIGQYLDQLATLAERLKAPLITGETNVAERQRLFAAFRSGEVDLLVVSKVANFSIDLPEASVAIQVSGTFGSRQEEAQRLGRVLRPKGDGRTAHFYTIVARDTVDADYAAHRQRFLAEQGYAYRIVDADDLSQESGPDGRR